MRVEQHEPAEAASGKAGREVAEYGKQRLCRKRKRSRYRGVLVALAVGEAGQGQDRQPLLDMAERPFQHRLRKVAVHGDRQVGAVLLDGADRQDEDRPLAVESGEIRARQVGPA